MYVDRGGANAQVQPEYTKRLRSKDLRKLANFLTHYGWTCLTQQKSAVQKSSILMLRLCIERLLDPKATQHQKDKTGCLEQYVSEVA